MSEPQAEYAPVAPTPGRLAFIHRHFALAYVRKRDPMLYHAACTEGYQRTLQESLTYTDYVGQIEEQLHAANLTVKQQAEQMRVLHLANEEQAKTIRQVMERKMP